MKTTNIEHTVVLSARPAKVYEALMNGRKHAQFTGEPASVRAKAGAAFSAYDGYITGFTLEVEPARLIVQAWRSQGWPAGHYSVVTFRLAKHGQQQTQLRFRQIGVPTKDYALKHQGWRTHYWQPLKRFLGK